MTITPPQAIEVPEEVVRALRGFPPTDEQWDAISMPREPFVIIAGAGSGKTAVMAARVVYLALVAMGQVPGVDPSQGAMPGSVLCLTFTNNATDNLAARVRSALAALDLPAGEEPVVSNYHAYAARLVAQYGLLVGVEPRMQLLSGPQRQEVAQRVLDRMTFVHNDATVNTLVGNIVKLADQMANHLVEPHQQIAFAQERAQQLARDGLGTDTMARALLQRAELAQAVECYEQLKQELGVIDFADQIRFAVRIVQERPEVVAAERSRFDAVLLDEYQDTNHAQAALLRTVFGDGFPVTAVGDPDQNIYAWRGASLHNLIAFPQEFPREDGSSSERKPLYTNFRSGAFILEAADQIVQALPIAQRPDPDKQLVAWPDNREGTVELARFRDEWQEAGWIADRVSELRDAGRPLAEIAVLSRKSRLFESLQAAFRERGIPVEIVGLAGLLQLPEIQEILAYARAAADATANIALARILLGPRYRIGPKDLAKIAQWTSKVNRDHRDDLDEDDALQVELAEALGHVDQIEGLSDEARERLHRFDRELRDLRAHAGKPVVEFFAEIVRRSGLAAELDAASDQDAASAVRRNLAAFLEQVQGFAPVEGDLTLGAFLDFIGSAETEDRQEWSPAQPSDDASVKIMTVHQAKGLEFDIVFVPGMAHGLLPDVTIQQNPAERAYSMDFELRGDASSLPTLAGCKWKMTAFKSALKDQERFEERRTAYVALTRAREKLFVTGAWFYGRTRRSKEASELFEDLLSWIDTSSHGVVSADDGIGDEEDPLAELRQSLVKPWPGPARPELRTEDPLFAQGWRQAAAAAAAGDIDTADLAMLLSAEERTDLAERSSQIRLLAGELLARAETDTSAATTNRLSPSALGTFATCPKRFYWDRVRPLPRFGSAAAELGTRIHSWIEHRTAGQGTLLDSEAGTDVPADHASDVSGPAPARFEELKASFEASRFARLTPLFAERAFRLAVEGATISGRIDAIYGDHDGRWDIVDYKSGKEYDPDDPRSWFQLELYALAAVEIWGKAASDLQLTYLFLSTGRELSRPVHDIDEIRARVAAQVRQIAVSDFPAQPSNACFSCDFRSFCETGKEWVSRSR